MSSETSNLHIVQFFNAHLLAHLDFLELNIDVSAFLDATFRSGASLIFIAILTNTPAFVKEIGAHFP